MSFNHLLSHFTGNAWWVRKVLWKPPGRRDLKTEEGKKAKKQAHSCRNSAQAGTWQLATDMEHTYTTACSAKHSWEACRRREIKRERCLDHRPLAWKVLATCRVWQDGEGVNGRGQRAATPWNEHPSQSSNTHRAFGGTLRSSRVARDTHETRLGWGPEWPLWICWAEVLTCLSSIARDRLLSVFWKERAGCWSRALEQACHPKQADLRALTPQVWARVALCPARTKSIPCKPAKLWGPRELNVHLERVLRAHQFPAWSRHPARSRLA